MTTISWDSTEASTPIALELAAVAEQLRRCTVQVSCHRHSSGSGVIWRSDGLIITNAHVATSQRATVKLSDGRELEAVRTNIYPQRDLAALRVEATDLPAATIGDSSALRVGELVLAMGNPLGIEGALTTGIIHAMGSTAQGSSFAGRGTRERERERRSRLSLPHSPFPDTLHPTPHTLSLSPNHQSPWIMADIRLAPGNSGGSLADAQGRVIGINTMIVGGLALAIPSNAVEEFLRDSAVRPYLGVTMRPVLVLLRNRRILGLSILDVAFGSLAAAAGLVKGDVLISIFGQYFHTPDDLTSVLWNAKPGDLLPLEFLRFGRLHSCTVNVSNSNTFTGVKSP